MPEGEAPGETKGEVENIEENINTGKQEEEEGKKLEFEREGEEEEEEVKSRSEKSKTKSTGFSSGVKKDSFGLYTGQIMSITNNLCKRAFLNAEPRVVEGMYRFTFPSTPENLGRMYGLLNKHRGTVENEELVESTNTFMINALIPVAESFKFTETLRQKKYEVSHP